MLSPGYKCECIVTRDRVPRQFILNTRTNYYILLQMVMLIIQIVSESCIVKRKPGFVTLWFSKQAHKRTYNTAVSLTLYVWPDADNLLIHPSVCP
jgi:hypothetical protein